MAMMRRGAFFKDFLGGVEWVNPGWISGNGTKGSNANTLARYTKDAMLLKAGTYKLVGFSYQEYVANDTTNFRIHAYNASDKWQRQITYQLIDWMSPVNMTFTLTSDTYVRLSLARKFIGHLIQVK